MFLSHKNLFGPHYIHAIPEWENIQTKAQYLAELKTWNSLWKWYSWYPAPCYPNLKRKGNYVTLSIDIIKSPGLGWLYVRFRRVRRRKNFSLSRQNHLSFWAKPLIFGTKNIWVWENVLDDLFKYLDPRSQLWHRLAKICLSVRWSENRSSDHYKTWQLCCPSHGYYLIRFWRHSVENSYFGNFFF